LIGVFKVPSGKGLSDELMISEALRLVEGANERGIALRLLGALAIRIHSQEYGELHRKLSRLEIEERSFSDIDLIGYGKQRKEIRGLMEKDLGFQVSRQFLLLHGRERLLYYHPKGLYHVDIFFDKLGFSHDLHFGSEPGRGRLELDYPTIPLADLLLEKIQIHEINEKDIKDVMVLLRAHELEGNVDKDVINVDYIVKILADDWGFWYDAKTNLGKVLEFSRACYERGLIDRNDHANIAVKINKLIRLIEEGPKSERWRKRAKLGTRKQWWRDVDEIVR